MAARRASVSRKTLETEVAVELALDGSGTVEVASGIGFFDHMLTALARHARFDLKLSCQGDLEVGKAMYAQRCAGANECAMFAR